MCSVEVVVLGVVVRWVGWECLSERGEIEVLLFDDDDGDKELTLSKIRFVCPIVCRGR